MPIKRRKLLQGLAVLATTLLDSQDAKSQTGPIFTIVGDSIGLRTSRYGGATRTTAITGQVIANITKQLVNIPTGTNIVVFGGTNDASAISPLSTTNLVHDATALVREARQRHLNILMWVGPPTVVRDSPYDRANSYLANNLVIADRELQTLMPSLQVPYMSLQQGFPFVHASDGLHQTEVGPNIILDELRSRIARQAARPTAGTSPSVRAPNPPR